MHWKLWEKRHKEGEPLQAKAEKLHKPQDIPEPVGRHLVVQLGKNPDWVWNLKGVLRKRQDREKAYDVRVFDLTMVAARKVTVRDYTSFDEHPDLILFEGWFDKKTLEVHIEEKGKPESTSRAA